MVDSALLVLMSSVLQKKGNVAYCWDQTFFSFCFLTSSPRCYLPSQAQTNQAQLPSEIQTETATLFSPFSISANGMFCTGHKHSPIITVHPTSITPTTTCASVSSGRTGKSLLVNQLDQHCYATIVIIHYIWAEKSKQNFNPCIFVKYYLGFYLRGQTSACSGQENYWLSVIYTKSWHSLSTSNTTDLVVSRTLLISSCFFLHLKWCI